MDDYTGRILGRERKGVSDALEPLVLGYALGAVLGLALFILMALWWILKLLWKGLKYLFVNRKKKSNMEQILPCPSCSRPLSAAYIISTGTRTCPFCQNVFEIEW